MTMSKPDLVRLFQMYRDMGVEPIPLIESFGHMEWLFANGKNLDLAVNKEIPYTIDPRNPQSQELLTKLWEEVLEALKPNVLHFGLDEVDMRGMEDNPAALTELWQKQLVFLSGLAEAHNVKMMLWGDQALAPGEAPDAAMGRTERDAALRRAAIARGSYIGDWHYLADSKPETYRKVLQLWKDAGMRPIASTWYKPQNIAGFDAEAARMNCGTLQTTWAGYESSEEAMLAAMPQFTAMVLAADYGWSGRTDPPSKLPYDPAEIFRRLYFGHPSPLSPNSGTDLGAPGGAFEIGQLHFGATLDLRLGSVLSPAEGAGSSISAAVQAKGREIGLAAACAIPCDEGQPVAEVVVTLANGKRIRERLVYGQNVRALSDRRPLATSERNSSGECGVRLELGANPVAVTRLEIRPLNTFSGLRVKGLVLVG